MLILQILPTVITEAVGVLPSLIDSVRSIFEDSSESGDSPGPISLLIGKGLAKILDDAEEDEVGDLLIALGEAGEMLKAAGKTLKQANPPVDGGGTDSQ